eukprot:TRINITY_DN876_c1_g1_i1.p3 TRINITY_DN876_c1_g1~~TRINITY_DN876_c1_g1_i1.p3  ORF type:complete len:398 (-),score=102.63 TRINITY_DN876_c1_g1_i1:3931-5124(-)
MEWVYIPQTDEPVVFEQPPSPPSSAAASEQSAQPLHFFAATSPAVEQPLHEQQHEDEYYGDDVVVNERISPVKAFEMFAGSVFPIADASDFSDSIYAPSAPVASKRISFAAAAPRLPASESRSQKLKRLRTEVESLASEWAPLQQQQQQQQQQPQSQLPDLTLLRTSLQQIEDNLNAELRPNRTIRVTTDAEHCHMNATESNHATKQAMTVQMLSPNVCVLQSLEKRVTAMEKALGIPRLDQHNQTIPLSPLLEDVRVRLALITDQTLPQRLKKDAEDIARILQSELRDEQGAHIVRMASVLHKIEKWEAVAESLPIVVQRFRCLKRVQDDATQFMQCLTVLEKQLDALQKRSDTNHSLVQKVRQNLETNMDAVEKNLDVLNSKLCTITHNEQGEQS